ncbi:MAG: HAMP domain-containing histidine kinase [Chloroflexota bacterium]|nr:HAMP domain-containing histidine kinase [Chloroflexota bacterium]
MALLTIGLTGALVVILAFTVYLTVRSALRSNLEGPLITRAEHQSPDLINLLHNPEHEREQEDVTAGVFITYVNAHLAIVGGSINPFGAAIPDPQAAAQAVQSGQPVLSARSSAAGQQYLLYSHPVIGHRQVIGVVQTGISSQQYARNLDALLRILLVVGAVGLLVSAAISALVVRRALHPIRFALRRQRDFVADAAHEFRTPLTVIRSTAEFGMKTDSAEEQHDLWDRVLVQSRHLTRMIADLSLLARADTGMLLLERRPLDLCHLIQQTVEDLEPLAADRSVQLTAQPCAEAHMLGDSDRLRQLLIILLDNALKHTPAGGAVTVSAEPDRQQLRLVVRDTGPGIAPHDLPHLFSRFYRADHSTGMESAGLGLAIGQSIAEAHGGHLEVANATEGGAIFTATLRIGRDVKA